MQILMCQKGSLLEVSVDGGEGDEATAERQTQLLSLSAHQEVLK